MAKDPACSMDMGISEQLARRYNMRLATDSCQRLADQLTARFDATRRNAITAALMEVVPGYEGARE
jgi:F0F1-type ATP synthase gamma subunit